MTQTSEAWWQRFNQWYWEDPRSGMALDFSRVPWPDGFHDQMQPKVQAAFAAMRDLENGAIANPDEARMVGHYWLRAPQLAPSPDITEAIDSTVRRISDFANKVLSGQVEGKSGKITDVIVIGIGGSALGPQFVSHALSSPSFPISLHVMDNTDPDGMDMVLGMVRERIGSTLTIVISKSGGTKETRNGMLETKRAYALAEVPFSSQAVAITQEGSDLDKIATAEGWLERFPMWDWVGGRTSELSAVGLLPAAIQGIDIDNLLKGAAEMDQLTRCTDVFSNPAMQMAMAWYAAGNGRGDRNLIILPYKDRLELFSKYLQQLIMESVGKEKDLSGKVVRQGLTVLGNKGSTDQHSFVQQLRDGRDDFLAVFIEVLKDRDGESIEVEPGLTSGDFLQGFYLGTRQALSQNGRPSISMTVPTVTDYSIGMLIAIFERTVGFYASLLGINAYHQPGVEAGKKAATAVVNLKTELVSALTKRAGTQLTITELAKLAGTDDLETTFKICKRLASNNMHGFIGFDVHIPSKARFAVA